MTLRRIGRPGRSAAALAGVAPQLSVERFLQAANARDFEAMERLFGTHDGPISGDRLELEVRMSLDRRHSAARGLPHPGPKAGAGARISHDPCDRDAYEGRA